MSKEEYAQLYSLLGKLKYEIGIAFSQSPNCHNLMNDNLQKINEVLTMTIFLSDDNKCTITPLCDYLKAEDFVLNEKD